MGSLVSSSEEGAVGATGVEEVLDIVAVLEEFFDLLAERASDVVNILYPFPLGEPFGQSREQWST